MFEIFQMSFQIIYNNNGEWTLNEHGDVLLLDTREKSQLKFDELSLILDKEC